MVLTDIIAAIVQYMTACVTFLRTTIVHYSGFSLSFWDIELAFIVLVLVLTVIFPHTGEGD